MTEDEAKTKWCPFASSRVVPWQKAPGALVNAVQAEAEGSPPSTACIASACMAWRTDRVETKEFQQTDREGTIVKSCKHGHCGLAGAKS